MANVEEDLGEGMYALRWAGNRIAVNSRAVLSTGQSLILKSEISPEGKPTLVVQGPALPDSGAIAGRVVYGPGDRAVRQASREDGSASGRPAGPEVAAGVAKAVTPQSSQPVGSLLGLVLEPLSDLDAAAARLMQAAQEEKDKWLPGADGKNAGQSKTSGQSGTAEQSVQAADKNSPPAETGAAGRPAAAELSRPEARPVQTLEAKIPPPAEAPPSSAPGKPDAASPLPAPSPEATDGSPSAVVSDKQETSSQQQSPPAAETGGSAGASRPEQSASDPRQPALPGAAKPEQSPPSSPEGDRPPDVPVREGGPVVPEVAETRPVGQSAGDSAAVRERPQTEAPPQPRAEAPSNQTRPETASQETVKGDVFVKEALTQLVKAAELPLASPSADTQSLGVSSRMPEAIADKAAGILLRAAGLSPDAATMEAARALVDNNVQVDRQTVQALMAIAAGVPEEDRAAVLQAAARLTAKDIPLSLPLASGLAEVMDRRAGVHALMEQTAAALDMQVEIAGAKPLLDAAKELLALLHVDLGQADAASALERYLTTFGRETLGKTLALVERAAQAVLEDHPLLPRIDKAMTSLLTLLEDSLARAEAEAAGGRPQTPPDPAEPKPAPPSAPSDREAASSSPQPSVPAAQPAAPNVPQGASPLPATPQGTPPAAVPPAPEVPVASPETGPAVPAAPPATAPSSETVSEGSSPQTEAKPLPADAPAQEQPPSAVAPPRSRINAYLNAPRAFPGLDALDLPPMPKVASLNAPPPEIPARPLPADAPPAPASPAPAQPPAVPGQNAPLPPQTPDQGALAGQPLPPVDSGIAPPVPAPPEQSQPTVVPGQNAPLPSQSPPRESPAGQPLPAGPESAPPDARPATPEEKEAAARFAEQLAKALGARPGQELSAEKARALEGNNLSRESAPPANLTEAQRQLRSSVLMKLESIFQLPGLNRPELEILRPLGILERFLNSPPQGEAAEKIRAEAEALTRDLLSDDPKKVAQALRDLPKNEPAVLREAASRLARMEAEILRSDPTMSRLSDASSSLRDLGRQLLAVKAENVAGHDREPGVMLAEVPLKFNDDAGDGRMQMFYRRSKGKQGGWTSRVILDLNTTGMGPVLGDMRFFGQDMILNMFVEKQGTADFLAVSADDLIAGLEGKGFRVKPRFMVLPPPPSPPELRAERPEIVDGEASSVAGEGPSSDGTRRHGRLDVKG